MTPRLPGSDWRLRRSPSPRGWLVPLSPTHLLLVRQQPQRREPLWWHRRKSKRSNRRFPFRANVAFVSGGIASGNAATSATVTFSPTGGTGHDIFFSVTLKTTTAAVSSITATGGTANFRFIGTQSNSTSVRVELWGAADVGTGITSFTVNFTSSKFSIAGAEYSGVAQWGLGGSNVSNTGTGTAASIVATCVRTGSYLVCALGLGATAETWAAGTNSTIDENGTNGGQTGGAGSKCNGILVRNTSTTASDLLQITIAATASASSAWALCAIELNPTADTVSGRAVQTAQCTVTSGDTLDAKTGGLAFRKLITLGDLLVVAIQYHGGGQPSLTDTDSNNWNVAVGPQQDGGVTPSFDGLMDYAANTKATGAAATDVIQIGGVSPVKVFAIEYSGAATSSPLDKTASAGGNSTSPSSGATAITTKSNELVVGFVADESVTGTLSAGTNFTLRQSQIEAGNEDKLVTSTGAQTATFTQTVSLAWACLVATFIDAVQPAYEDDSYNVNPQEPNEFLTTVWG